MLIDVGVDGHCLLEERSDTWKFILIIIILFIEKDIKNNDENNNNNNNNNEKQVKWNKWRMS